jgi:hypothetical protein
MADDHASVRVLADGGPAPEVRAMAIAPNDAAHIYLAVGNKNAELVESADSGAHWRKTADLSSVVQHIYVDPREHALFVTGRAGLSIRHGPLVGRRAALWCNLR